MKKPFSFLAAFFLWGVALAHVARIVFRVTLLVGGVPVPLWCSMFPVIALPLLAIMLWKEAGA